MRTGKIGYRFPEKAESHPEWTCIMLDYDRIGWQGVTKKISPWLDDLRKHFKACDVRSTHNTLKNKKGWHVRIWIDLDLKPRRLNDLQAGMGDDPSRVRMNERRIKRGIEPWNRLWLAKFKLDGTIISSETEAPGATSQLKEMLAPSDTYFREMRTNE